MQETPPIPGVSIRRRLAVGGMAELFLADETLADGSARPCVVKRLLPGAGAEAERLFAREALALAALASLDSPHIVRLYRSGPGWLLLEWVDGAPRPFPDETAQSMFETPLGVVIDRQNRLWTIDHGTHGTGTPRLMAFDLAAGEVVLEHPEAAVAQGLALVLHDVPEHLRRSGARRATEGVYKS